MRFGIFLKIFTAIYLTLYIPYKVILAIVGFIMPTFLRSNTVIQIRKKSENFKKCRHYLRILLEKSPDHLLMDNHFFKMSIYLKLASLIFQFVIDLLLGVVFLLILKSYSSQILEILHYFGQGLHIEVLERQVKWLMGLPAGFKPNPNLDNFLGNLMLDIISLWNIITSELTEIEPILLSYLAVCGSLGISTQLALCHDVLFICSAHIFILYTVFAIVYKYILNMMGTLIRLFGGKKYNVLRKRVD